MFCKHYRSIVCVVGAIICVLSLTFISEFQKKAVGKSFDAIDESNEFRSRAEKRISTFSPVIFFFIQEFAEMLKKILSTIFLIAASFAAAPAQSSAEQTVRNASDRFFDIKNRSIEMERVKREAYKRTVSENFTLNFSEIREDFERIQKINDELFERTRAEKPLDNSAVLKLVSEINRRTVRLHSNLFPPEPERKNTSKSKQTDNDESPDVKNLLAALDTSINSFVHSPIFQNINLVNAADSLKAQKDLETIINISKRLKTKMKN